MSKTASIVLSIVLTALIAGGGTYYLTSQAAQSDKQELESQIEELQAQMEEMRDEKLLTSDSQEIENFELKSYTDSDNNLSFAYPESWGEVTKETISSTNNETVSGSAEYIGYSFSSFPGDKEFSQQNYLGLYQEKDYKESNDEANQAYSYLKSVYENESIQNLELPSKEVNLFGKNIAKKSQANYISSDENDARGVYFLMRDGNGYGTDISLNAALLNNEGRILGATLYVWSQEQKELQTELNQLQSSGSSAELEAWDTKMDLFLSQQATTIFATEIDQLKNLIGSLSY